MSYLNNMGGVCVFFFYHNNCMGHVLLNVKEFKIIREETCSFIDTLSH